MWLMNLLSIRQTFTVFAFSSYKAWTCEESVNANNKEGKAFHHLRQTFPRISDVKIKRDIFAGPQIL